MIDYAKRKTLKIIGTVSAAAATMTTATGSLANAVVVTDEQVGSIEELPLADISVSTRVSTTTNDLEVVLTNSGESAATITQVTPLEMHVNRGKFDFSRLLQSGDLHLHPGQSVVVPMEPVRVNAGARIKNNAQPMFAVTPMADSPTLATALQKNISVVTEGDAWAKVTILDQSRLA